MARDVFKRVPSAPHAHHPPNTFKGFSPPLCENPPGAGGFSPASRFPWVIFCGPRVSVESPTLASFREPGPGPRKRPGPSGRIVPRPFPVEQLFGLCQAFARPMARPRACRLGPGVSTSGPCGRCWKKIPRAPVLAPDGCRTLEGQCQQAVHQRGLFGLPLVFEAMPPTGPIRMTGAAMP